MSEHEATFSSVINSPEFRNAVKTAMKKPIRRDDFFDLPMPTGVTPSQMWDLVMLIEHCAGESLEVKPWFSGVSNQDCWFFLPASATDDLYDIASRASGESQLNRFILENEHFDQLFLEDVYEETANVARYDGINVTVSTVRMLWTDERRPSSIGEQIIANFSKAFYDVKRLVGSRPYSRMLISDIQSLLLRGIRDSDLQFEPHYHWPTSLCEPGILDDPTYGAEMLDSVIERIQKFDGAQNMILSAIIAAKSLCDVHYVDHLRNLTELLTRRTFFLQNGVPALSYVPFSCLNDVLFNAYQETHAKEALSAPKEGLCATWNYIAGIKAYQEGVHTLEQKMEQAENRLHRLRSMISRIPRITARQKAFLITALTDTNKSYSIKQYISSYNVVYSTARSDLLELVELGFLRMYKSHNTLLFQGISSSGGK